jgi:hypothetical protein
MNDIATFEEASVRSRSVDVHGQRYLLREFVGTAPKRGTYVEGDEANDDHHPQGFLVDQPPGTVTPPHFHESDQFQVFVGGRGRFGKKSVRPVMVQYAGRHTPYGPIRAGSEGVRYYTLRQRWDPGAKYMPAMRHRLVRGQQRQRLSTALTVPDPREAGALAAVEALAAEPDGLCATLLLLPPREAATAPDPATGNGQYQVVLAGELVHDHRAYGALSVRHVACREPAPPPLLAGAGGLAVLVLQFPRRGA